MIQKLVVLFVSERSSSVMSNSCASKTSSCEDVSNKGIQRDNVVNWRIVGTEHCYIQFRLL